MLHKQKGMLAILIQTVGGNACHFPKTAQNAHQLHIYRDIYIYLYIYSEFKMNTSFLSSEVFKLSHMADMLNIGLILFLV